MTSSSKPILISLNPDRIKLDQGFCYVYDLPVDSPWGDDEHNPYSSTAVLFENGRALGPTHAPHDIIRTQGGGWFSHWNRQLYFSTSDNTPPDLNGRHYYLYVPAEIGSDPEWSFIEHVKTEPQDSKPVLISLNRDRIRPHQGFCYVYDLPVDSPSGDDEHNPYSSTAVLFENGGALGPTHAPHDIIRTQGGGWFSHWNRQLYFSTSDNTPPDLNGRHYYLYVPADIGSDPEWSFIEHVKAAPQDVPLQKSLVSLNRDHIRLDQGFCYVYDLPVDSPSGDDEHNPYSSTAILFENGGALGPTHAPHDNLELRAAGSFRIRDRQLYFSTSDNTPPDLNGRHYCLYVPADTGSDPEWSFIEHVKAAPEEVPLREKFDVARRAFRRIWGNAVLPDHGRRIDHDDEFAREFARLSPESDVTADRKFNLNQLFKLAYSVVGDVAECGTYKGASAYFLARHIQLAALNKKLLLLILFKDSRNLMPSMGPIGVMATWHLTVMMSGVPWLHWGLASSSSFSKDRFRSGSPRSPTDISASFTSTSISIGQRLIRLPSFIRS